MEKKKIMKLVAASIGLIGVIVFVMLISFVHGTGKQNGSGSVFTTEKESSSVLGESIAGEQEELQESDRSDSSATREEILGMKSGEEDDFTMASDPEHFDVKVNGYSQKIASMTAAEPVFHDSLKAWLKEMEFWDMTEVAYAGKYMRDDAGKETILYFTISRYPKAPLKACWKDAEQSFQFEIEWE